jgi:hypothetical protein
MKTYPACVLSFAVTLGACQSFACNTGVSNLNSQTATTPASSQPIKAEDILDALKAAKVPIEKEIVYTPETDPNNLLGRPNQYVGKASWNDKRAPKSDDRDMTVEVFASKEDLENRRRYVETVTKLMSPLAEYQYVHKNALIRLNHKLTPQQAAETKRF